MMKRLKNPLIASVAVLVGLLVVLVWFNAARNVRQEYRTLAAADRAAVNNELLDNLLQAGQNLSFERGRTNVLMNAPDAATEQDLDFVRQRRKAVDNFLERTIHSEYLGTSDEAITVRYDYATVQNLRKDIDAALALDKDDRDPLLAARWYDTATKMLADIGTLALADTIARTDSHSPFESLNRLKIFAFDFRTTLGTEATRIAECLSAGRRMTGEEIERVQNLRGQVDAIWKTLSREAGLGNRSGIQPAMQVIVREVFYTYRPIQDAVLAALMTGEKPPYELQKVLLASVPALDSVAKLQEALTAETGQQIARTRRDAKRSFIGSIVEAVISLAAGFAALYLFIIRLILPLRSIGNQLEKLAAGDLDVALEGLKRDRDDEISRTWTALQSFRESLIERKALEKRLRTLGSLDGLTGIPNRRALDEALESEWRRDRRTNETIALAMIDVDFFKKFNDRYGHIAGDDCLKKIAASLRESAKRAGDFVGRYGGEEFVAILPGLALDEAITWAETLRAAVERTRIPHEDSHTGCVTVSIGLVSLSPDKAGNMLELIRLADEALYRAKANGRNRVEFFT